MIKNNKKKKTNILNKVLDVPEEIANKETKITILGFKRLLLENYCTILDYQDFYLRIKTKNGIININGFNMKLNDMNSDDVMIEGDIDSIDFEKIEDKSL